MSGALLFPELHAHHEEPSCGGSAALRAPAKREMERRTSPIFWFFSGLDTHVNALVSSSTARAGRTERSNAIR